jgi:ABC-2 type transport system permease protein
MKWGMSDMQSKTLSFNRGIWKQNVRNVGWIGLVYFLCLLFSLPLQLLMINSSEERTYFYDAKGLFDHPFLGGFQILLMFIVPVLLAVFMFRYLHVKLSADYIHSLPIRRESLFHQQVSLGSLILIVPVVVTGIILWILYGALDFADFFPKAEIGHWVLVTILWDLFVFFAGVFVAMFTGMSVLHGALIYILLFFPAGILVLTFMNTKYFLFGFAVDYYLDANIETIIPFARASQMAVNPLAGTEMLMYVMLIILFYVVALFVYKKRHIEAATQAIAFRPLQPVFKYGVTFCTMLLGGLYFGETQDDFGWLLFGFIAGSLIGYLVAEMILQKTWRVFDKRKGYFYFALAMFIAAMLLQMDITGYEKKIPELTDVKRVYFGESVYPLTDQYKKQKQMETATQGDVYVEDEQDYYFEDKENIKHIYDLHRQIIKEKPDNGHPRDTRSVVIAYELNNGKRMVRHYEIPFNAYKPLYKPIVESDEFKENRYSLLRQGRSADIDKITIQPDGPTNKKAIITEPQKIKEFAAILKEELKAETSDQMFEDGDSWGSINMLYNNNKQMDIAWKKSYTKVEKWLKENGLLEEARVMPADLAYAVAIKNEEGKEVHHFIQANEVEEKFKDRPDALKIQDKQQLEECLRDAKQKEQGAYIIAFYFMGDPYPDFQVFDENSAPSFIKQHFTK